MVRKTVGMFTYKIKIPTAGLRAHFIRKCKKQKWERYNERALVFGFVLFFCFVFVFYTKFHVQALKSTLTGTYEIYSLSYRTF